MQSAKITVKGQVTLPAGVLTELGLKPGDRVDFVRNRHGNFEIIPNAGTSEDLRGIRPYGGPPLSEEEIVASVKAGRDKRADHIMSVLKDAGILPEDRD